jgi:hypothetical protein
MSSQIASAAEQQQATSADIATNLNRISDISDLNYQGIERVAETSKQLDSLCRAAGGWSSASASVPDGHDPMTRPRIAGPSFHQRRTWLRRRRWRPCRPLHRRQS